MSPQTTTAALADQLPGALLPSILQHVPLQQRLASCALVCRSWAPAAAAATDKLNLTVRRPARKSAATEGSAADPSSISMTATQPEEASCLEVSGFTGWLQQHGSNLNRLQLQCIIPGQGTTDVKAQLQLPCPALVQLTSLSLDSCVVSTAPHGSQQAAAAVSTQALPQLVDLKLNSCKFTSPASFQQLASATSLTALELQQVWWDDSPQPQAAAGTGSQPSTLAAVLQASSGLRRLRLSYWDDTEDLVFMPPSSLAVISRLRQLQDLHVFLPVVAGDPVYLPLPCVPSGTTRLVLTAGDPCSWSEATFELSQPGLSQLCTLQLCNVAVHSTALSSMSKLQQLVIDRCVLLPEAARVSALLTAVGELKFLHELKLVLDCGLDVQEVPSVAFSALTASSQLRVLHAELAHDTGVALPGPDVLQHMFPAGRQLGQLHTLVLGSVQSCTSQWRVPLEDLARIVTSCPALQTLSLVDVFEQGNQDYLRPLLDLTMLSSLCVGGAAWDNSAARVVAQLTQLTSLEWVLTQVWLDDGQRIKNQLSRTGLAQLAALERLQRFSISRAEALVDNPSLHEDLGFLPELAASDQDGPVWIQILKLSHVPEFVVRWELQRRQQHAADMQELQRLRSRVAELEQRTRV